MSEQHLTAAHGLCRCGRSIGKSWSQLNSGSKTQPQIYASTMLSAIPSYTSGLPSRPVRPRPSILCVNTANGPSKSSSQSSGLPPFWVVWPCLMATNWSCFIHCSSMRWACRDQVRPSLGQVSLARACAVSTDQASSHCPFFIALEMHRQYILSVGRCRKVSPNRSQLLHSEIWRHYQSTSKAHAQAVQNLIVSWQLMPDHVKSLL